VRNTGRQTGEEAREDRLGRAPSDKKYEDLQLLWGIFRVPASAPMSAHCRDGTAKLLERQFASSTRQFVDEPKGSIRRRAGPRRAGGSRRGNATSLRLIMVTAR
jgi:hypothetical protein